MTGAFLSHHGEKFQMPGIVYLHYETISQRLGLRFVSVAVHLYRPWLHQTLLEILSSVNGSRVIYYVYGGIWK